MRKLKKAYLEITNVCNLSCSFCPGTRRARGFLTPEQFRLLAGKLRPHTEYLYLHLMGEPLLHPRLEELLEAGEALDFRLMLTTNGTLLPQREELLCRSPAVKRVSISLHSFEGNGARGDMEAYLEGCLTFVARAAEASSAPCACGTWTGRRPPEPTPGTRPFWSGWGGPFPGPGRRAGRG